MKNTNDPFKELSLIFKVLANPIRLKILAYCLNTPQNSQALRKKLNISKPLLIAHLRKLINAGLLKYEVKIDEEHLIIRKFYKTADNINICLNRKVLELLKNRINKRQTSESSN